MAKKNIVPPKVDLNATQIECEIVVQEVFMLKGGGRVLRDKYTIPASSFTAQVSGKPRKDKSIDFEFRTSGDTLRGLRRAQTKLANTNKVNISSKGAVALLPVEVAQAVVIESANRAMEREITARQQLQEVLDRAQKALQEFDAGREERQTRITKNLANARFIKALVRVHL